MPYLSLLYGQDQVQCLAQGSSSVNGCMHEQLEEGRAQAGCLVSE